MEIFVAYLKTLFRITENHKLYNEVTTTCLIAELESSTPLMSRSTTGRNPKMVPSTTTLITQYPEILILMLFFEVTDF
jgi:hypothetical protein